jgi:hypothetical protein
MPMMMVMVMVMVMVMAYAQAASTCLSASHHPARRNQMVLKLLTVCQGF